eukprot:1891213-Pleurochrysis_carterae.AAC.1
MRPHTRARVRARTRTRAHSHTRTLAHAHSHTHTRTRAHSHTHTRTLAHAHTHTRTRAHALTRTRAHSHTRTLAHSHTRTLAHPLAHPHSPASSDKASLQHFQSDQNGAGRLSRAGVCACITHAFSFPHKSATSIFSAASYAGVCEKRVRSFKTRLHSCVSLCEERLTGRPSWILVRYRLTKRDTDCRTAIQTDDARYRLMKRDTN